MKEWFWEHERMPVWVTISVACCDCCLTAPGALASLSNLDVQLDATCNHRLSFMQQCHVVLTNVEEHHDLLRLVYNCRNMCGSLIKPPTVTIGGCLFLELQPVNKYRM